MEIRARSHLGDLAEDVRKSRPGLGIVNVQGGVSDGTSAVLRHRPVDRGFRMRVGTVEFGEGVQHRVGVGRRVNLGDHHDVASSGIGDDAAVLLLSVEPGATQLIAVAVLLGVHCGVSGHRGEFRVVESVAGCAALIGDLDPPALIVGQVHV